MKTTLKTGLIFAFAWMLLRYLFYVTGIFGEQQNEMLPAILLNILFVLLSVSFGLYLHKKNNPTPTSALQDIKDGMSAGVPYTVLVSAFIYVFYAFINPDYNKHQIAEANYGIQQMLDDPEKLAKLKNENADYEVKTKEEIYKNMIQGPKSFYNPQASMIVSLLALLLLSTVNSIFVTVVFRKLIFRQ